VVRLANLHTDYHPRGKMKMAEYLTGLQLCRRQILSRQ
jgi:hypothetical protein